MKMLLFLLALPALGFAQQSPKEIVTYLFTSLTNGQVQHLLNITADRELEKTKELQGLLKDKKLTVEDLIKQYHNVKSWKITDSQEHKIDNRTLTVVNTEWVMAIPLEENPQLISDSKKKKNYTLYVDYMLEKLNGTWKIISTRTRN